MYISELMTGAPTNERCPLERRMYETLDKLKIPYERVDNDPAASMEECAEVDKVLGTEKDNIFPACHAGKYILRQSSFQ